MQLSELKEFFHEVDIPPGPIKLDDASTIIDLRKMIDSHIKYLEGNSGRKCFLPYYMRLVKVFRHIKKKSEN